MTTRNRSQEIYNEHIALASTHGRLFRKTVINQMMDELGVSLASASTHYNNCKKANPVEGLGRATASKGVRKTSAKGVTEVELQPDSECFTVIELVSVDGNTNVCRSQSHLTQGDASESFDEKIEAWPNSKWVMIKGLGPNPGDTFKLDMDEKEVKRYEPV